MQSPHSLPSTSSTGPLPLHGKPAAKVQDATIDVKRLHQPLIAGRLQFLHFTPLDTGPPFSAAAWCSSRSACTAASCS